MAGQQPRRAQRWQSLHVRCAPWWSLSLLAEGGRNRAAFAAFYGLLVAAPMAVGLVAWRMQPDSRFARLLVAVGALFSPTALSQSSDARSTAWAGSRVWLVEPRILLLMLAFPSGQLTHGRDRRLMAASLVLVAHALPPERPDDRALPGAVAVGGVRRRLPTERVRRLSLPRPGGRRRRDPPAARGARRAAADRRSRVSLVATLSRARGRCCAGRWRPSLAIAVLPGRSCSPRHQWARRGGTVSDAVELLGWILLLSAPGGRPELRRGPR